MAERTVLLHRVLTAPAERVYRAFIDPAALARWLPPHGFTATVHEMDARVGGTCRISFTNFTTKNSHSFRLKFVELTPNTRIRYVDTFDDPSLPGEMPVDVSLREFNGGTELRVKQENIPAAIPLEMCYLGWQESLGMLAKLVEPTIPDGP